MRLLGFKSIDESLDTDMKRIRNNQRTNYSTERQKVLDSLVENPYDKEAQKQAKILGITGKEVKEERNKKRTTSCKNKGGIELNMPIVINIPNYIPVMPSCGCNGNNNKSSPSDDEDSTDNKSLIDDYFADKDIDGGTSSNLTSDIDKYFSYTQKNRKITHRRHLPNKLNIMTNVTSKKANQPPVLLLLSGLPLQMIIPFGLILPITNKAVANNG